MAAFDVIVIGLGAMGAAAADHLARRGARVLGIERFGIAHGHGSSHGRSRAIRLAYFEDPAYVPLLRRAYENWRDLERRSGESLLSVTGTLEIGRPDGAVVAGSLASCRSHDLMHELLDRAVIRRRYPVFELPEDYVALWQPDGGYLRPEAAVAASIGLAAEAGARLHFGERVLAIAPGSGAVTVVTDTARHEAGQVIVAAGPWLADLVPEIAPHLRPTRQVLGWFWPRDMAAFGPGRFPVFIVDDGAEGAHYGFPAFENSAVKVARHGHLDEPVGPDNARRPAGPEDVAVLRRFLAARLPLLDGEPVQTATCTYSRLPEDFFLIDRAPSDPRILVASPCSGHGFKFASVIGEILADLTLTGATPLPIAPFSWAALEARSSRAAS